jgi:hypothetical protein
MLRPDVVVVERMAAGTGLIKSFAAGGIAAEALRGCLSVSGYAP